MINDSARRPHFQARTRTYMKAKSGLLVQVAMVPYLLLWSTTSSAWSIDPLLGTIAFQLNDGQVKVFDSKYAIAIFDNLT